LLCRDGYTGASRNGNHYPSDTGTAAARVRAGRCDNGGEVVRSALNWAPERCRLWPPRDFPYLSGYEAEAQPPRVVRFVHTARDPPTILGLLE